jgi:hypothetical protein
VRLPAAQGIVGGGTKARGAGRAFRDFVVLTTETGDEVEEREG